MNLHFELKLSNKEYLFLYQGHSFLAIKENDISLEQANKVYDQLLSTFTQAIYVSTQIKSLPPTYMPQIIDATSHIFNAAVKLGVDQKIDEKHLR